MRCSATYWEPGLKPDDYGFGFTQLPRDDGCDHVIMVLGAAQVAAPAGVVTVTAPDWETGLSAICAAGLVQAEQMCADYAVLHVIDTPDVGAPVVGRVIKRALASRSGLARAHFGERRGHPVVIARPHWPASLNVAHASFPVDRDDACQ